VYSYFSVPINTFRLTTFNSAKEALSAVVIRLSTSASGCTRSELPRNRGSNFGSGKKRLDQFYISPSLLYIRYR
jgi:hypothetical protein